MFLYMQGNGIAIDLGIVCVHVHGVTILGIYSQQMLRASS